MTPGGELVSDTRSTPVDHALAQLSDSFDALLAAVESGGLDHYDDHQLVEVLQRFEHVRNRLPLVDHALLTDAEARRLSDRLTQPSLARVLVHALRLSSSEAHRRVRAAEAVGERRTMTGESLAPRRPVLAAAQRAGQVTPEQVNQVVRALQRVDRPGFDPADIAAGEALLTGHAMTFDPKVLGLLADQVVEAIDPDGTLPDDRLNADRRDLSLRPTRDGMYRGEFRLTGVLGAKLSAVLRPLARPRAEQLPCPEGADARAAALAGSDERTYGQRMHDALEDVCDRLLRSGQLPDSGGTPATVVVTVTLDDLLERVGYGLTADGVQLSAEQVLRLADQAEIIPTVLAQSGAVLTQGRSRRIASAAQTWALVARDGGCSFPGCDRTPDLCERHHIVAWVDGGATDVDNLTLLCRYHHAQFAGRGWTAALNSDGLPEWTPPGWIDRQRRPMVNTRIALALLSRRRAGRRSRGRLLAGSAAGGAP